MHSNKYTIEKRIYDEKELDTSLKKTTLRKLIRDTCKKTIFSCNGVYYEQIDGVSMGGSLGPVLANIILTEFEQVIIDPLINSGIIKFYCRYVDDTLLLIKRDDIDFLLHKFHSFDHNIRFTYDAFSDEPPHFLDLNLDGNRFSIYRKHTFTGQYTHFDSFVPWKHRTAWLRSLLSRAYKICSPSNLQRELNFIRRIASWNDFPKQVVSSLIKRFRQHHDTNNDTNETNDNNTTTPTLWFEMPYIGHKGEQLLRGLKKKLKRCLNISDVRIVTRTTTTKLNMFTNMKDKTPKENKSNVVYEFTCQKCSNSYIGKTERTLLERAKEHAYKDNDSAINKHLQSCYEPDDLTNKTNKELVDLVVNNTKVIDSARNWNLLLYKEALHIKRRKCVLNNGLKASKELQLFN